MKPFFVFSGQGAQAVGMGRDLYENSTGAKRIFVDADAALRYSITEVCFNGPAEKLTETRYCQVAIYTMSCAALTAFREKFGDIEPVACAGLSLGEYAALYAGKAFSFEDGILLLAQRAELMDLACQNSSGTMASILGGDVEVIKEVCALCEVDVANYNSPGQIVISGEKKKMAAAIEMLKEKGQKKVIPLNVAGAFHSRLMKHAGNTMNSILATAAIEMPQIPVYHNFTAMPAKNMDEMKHNLAKQVAGSVKWEESVRNMIKCGGDTMIEFGPGNVLTGLLRRTDSNIKYYNVNSYESLNSIEL